MSQVRYDGYSEPRSSKVPIFSLAARVATFASLVVTVVILQTNKVTLNTGFRLTYSSLFHSYRQVVSTNYLGGSTIIQKEIVRDNLWFRSGRNTAPNLGLTFKIYLFSAKIF